MLIYPRLSSAEEHMKILRRKKEKNREMGGELRVTIKKKRGGGVRLSRGFITCWLGAPAINALGIVEVDDRVLACREKDVARSGEPTAEHLLLGPAQGSAESVGDETPAQRCRYRPPDLGVAVGEGGCFSGAAMRGYFGAYVPVCLSVRLLVSV